MKELKGGRARLERKARTNRCDWADAACPFLDIHEDRCVGGACSVTYHSGQLRFRITVV